ncbi:hypothetical protein GJV85_12200 [Sulfurimonas aquatica]|uniref:Uncharacterized protein n=1 Tax=Sulfurimonas aquatica TaxID=2672570 RepID=A0A975B252_9BACT|nr:hypothetical protein [Sulfurimonas aquatica]QSZ42837.1 hypothetical protein GJV85_12200 [Sulfurimonas aquatica]
MKMTNYRLQTEIEHLTPLSQKDWFKNYVKEVLESDKPYHVKADYIGLSFQELQNKIDYLSSDIKELQALKRTLTQSKTLAQEVTAAILLDYGIDRLDGTSISSITIQAHKTKLKETFKIINAEALIKLGFCTVTVDEQAVKDAMLTVEGMDEIDEFVKVDVTSEEVPAKIKVNARRSNQNNQATELLNLVDSQEAA